MNKEDINFLNSLFSTLSIISTNGESTIYMGECLKQLNQFIKQKEQEIKEE